MKKKVLDHSKTIIIINRKGRVFLFLNVLGPYEGHNEVKP